MAPIPEDLLPKTSFFVPRYQLKIGGKPLHKEGNDVLSLTFKDSVKSLSAMEIVLNNLDDDGRSQPRFKYSDGGTPVELGQKFELSMGYQDTPGVLEMMTGEIVAFDPHFPASGPPTVTVRGLDRLHRVRNKPQKDTWENRTDSEIATLIAERNGLGPAIVSKTNTVHKVIQQGTRDDISFLLERAKRIDFEVFVKNDVLHFVHTREGNDALFSLRFGQLLRSFEPSLTLAGMVSKVTVRCWDHKKGVLIEKTADRAKLKELTVDGTDGGSVLEDALGEGKEEIITTEAVSNEEDAQKLAESILRLKSHSFVTGTGETIGLPNLRAGSNIRLEGLGSRFNGVYYVTESTHKINQSGYQTSFSVRKAYIGKKGKAA